MKFSLTFFLGSLLLFMVSCTSIPNQNKSNLNINLAIQTSNKNIYTQWDYQAGAWQQNEGVRIDHFLLNPLATDKLISFGIDKYMRTLDRPSDHVPIWITMSS